MLRRFNTFENKEDKLIDRFLYDREDLANNASIFRKTFKTFLNGNNNYDLYLTKEQSDKFHMYYSGFCTGAQKIGISYILTYRFKDNKGDFKVTIRHNEETLKEENWYDKALEYREKNIDIIKKMLDCVKNGPNLHKDIKPHDLENPTSWHASNWRWFRNVVLNKK